MIFYFHRLQVAAGWTVKIAFRIVILLATVPISIVALFGIAAAAQYFWRERIVPPPPSLSWSHCPKTPSEGTIYTSLSAETFPTATFIAGASGTTIATVSETDIRLRDLQGATSEQVIPLPLSSGEPTRVVLHPTLEHLLVETRTSNFEVNLLALTIPDGKLLWRENGLGRTPRVLFFTPNPDIIGYDGFERLTFVNIAQGSAI